MKIVVLDGYALNPGDLSWSGFTELGELTVFDRTPAHQAVQRAAHAEAVLTNKVALPRSVQEQLPALRYIGVLATGYDIVDVEAARHRGIVVTNVPEYGTFSVAQHTFALLLELCHHVGLHSESVRRSEWSRNPDWCYWKTPLIELAGKTMGIIGLGRIGRQTARLAHAFGMRVIAHSRPGSPPLPFDGFRFLNLEAVLAESDVVSLHCPLTSETRGLINRQRLACMKPTAFLLNCSRGPLVVESDLAEALRQGVIAGAALDVLSQEPPPPDHPLFSAPNCILTPHHAWATREARERLMNIAVENLRAFLAGRPQNVVS